MVFKEVKKVKLEHEQIVFCRDQKTGLRAIIAIHNTNLGPTLGGCRMHPYKNEEDALRDVLNLSEGMSYKSAFADVELGGGKSVIIADPKTEKTPELLRSFGKFVDSLGGKYITAKDVGIKDEDLMHVAQETKYVVGSPKDLVGVSHPSAATARGVFYSLKWSVKKKLKKDSLKGIRVVVQGAGAVGRELVKHLLEESAEVFIYDIQEKVLQELKQQYPALNLINQEHEVFTTPCDVFAPCAMGSVLNSETIKTLNCSIIAGAANNQLENDEIGEQIYKKGIFYLPDFVINSGGLVFVYSLLEPKKLDGWVSEKLKSLPKSLDGIYEISEKQNVSMQNAALQFAVNKIQSASELKKNDFLAVSNNQDTQKRDRV